jgi:hypothetical protein
MVVLLFITPLYCTSLAFGFYFRVVVTIRARTLWLSRFWLRLDHLIKPCFCLLRLCSRFTSHSLSLMSFHAHYESLHRSLPSASLARFHVPTHAFPRSAYCTFLIACFTPFYILVRIPCLLESSLISGSVCGSSPL